MQCTNPPTMHSHSITAYLDAISPSDKQSAVIFPRETTPVEVGSWAAFRTIDIRDALLRAGVKQLYTEVVRPRDEDTPPLDGENRALARMQLHRTDNHNRTGTECTREGRFNIRLLTTSAFQC